jgi:hypothetical protein
LGVEIISPPLAIFRDLPAFSYAIAAACLVAAFMLLGLLVPSFPDSLYDRTISPMFELMVF